MGWLAAAAAAELTHDAMLALTSDGNYLSHKQSHALASFTPASSRIALTAHTQS
jgi:hypothetical protein